MSVKQSTDYRIRFLAIEVKDKSAAYDVSNVFQELNLYDNLFAPCISGSVLITDSLGILEDLSLDGDEWFSAYLDKGAEDDVILQYKKRFIIYKVSNVQKINSTTKSYVVHFVSPEFWKSMRTRINQTYTGLYSDFVKSILTKKLGVMNAFPYDGKSGIGSIMNSTGQQRIIIPNMTPFEAIDWMTHRAIPAQKKYPDYVFFETQFGYNFMSLGELYKQDSLFDINFSPKNISGSIDVEFLGVRDFKIKTSFNGVKNTMTGVYGGKFIGFDPLTRRRVERNISFTEIFNNTQHANKYPLLPLNKTDILNSPNSRVVTFPFMESRKESSEVNSKDPGSLNVMMNTHDFAFQRKSIIYNLMQRRLEFVLPGNFTIRSGSMLQLNFPRFKYTTKETTENFDETMTGRYIVTGVRHIVKYAVHETMVEVATDSTNKNTGPIPTIDFNNPN